MAAVNGGIVDSIVEVPDDATVRVMLSSLERNLLPDADLHRLIRHVFINRLAFGYKPPADIQLSDLHQFAQSLREMPKAIETEEDKSQLYELPTSFFKPLYGKYLKFRQLLLLSRQVKQPRRCWESNAKLYCERSQIKDGHSVLDLGCGWGSLVLYIAQKYPNCQITGIVDSISQKEYIEEQCRDLQLQNVEAIVADISTFDMEASYDRIYSIELFEHMKNYQGLLKKMSKWLKSDGLLFVEHCCHKTYPLLFKDVNEDDWLTKHFNGSIFPSAHLLLYFQDDVSVVSHWLVNGKHYAQTSKKWLENMDHNMSSIKPIMESTYGQDSAVKWTVYWRTFFIAVAELFGYNNGDEWMISHLLFKKK